MSMVRSRGKKGEMGGATEKGILGVEQITWGGGGMGGVNGVEMTVDKIRRPLSQLFTFHDQLKGSKCIDITWSSMVQGIFPKFVKSFVVGIPWANRKVHTFDGPCQKLFFVNQILNKI